MVERTGSEAYYKCGGGLDWGWRWLSWDLRCLSWNCCPFGPILHVLLMNTSFSCCCCCCCCCCCRSLSEEDIKLGGKQPSCYVLVVWSMRHEEMYLAECKLSDKYFKDT
jgi:hypothetical protein